jgi:hypothetical protein
MKRVSLVATVHKEQGLANASELQAILERIRPEVIFLELPAADFADYFDDIRMPLEATAASRYRALYPVELVPVDLPTPGDEFRQNCDCLFDRVEEASPEYCRLHYTNSQYIWAYGFAYLNDVICSTLCSAIHEAMRTTIEELGDRRLIEIYEEWTHANELREEAMMKSVEDYSTQNPFDKGVMFVGAAHRQSIIDKSRTRCEDGMPTVQWDFEAFWAGPHRDGST